MTLSTDRNKDKDIVQLTSWTGHETKTLCCRSSGTSACPRALLNSKESWLYIPQMTLLLNTCGMRRMKLWSTYTCSAGYKDSPSLYYSVYIYIYLSWFLMSTYTGTRLFPAYVFTCRRMEKYIYDTHTLLEKIINNLLPGSSQVYI